MPEIYTITHTRPTTQKKAEQQENRAKGNTTSIMLSKEKVMHRKSVVQTTTCCYPQGAVDNVQKMVVDWHCNPPAGRGEGGRAGAKGPR
jgi:hypothetical protein